MADELPYYPLSPAQLAARNARSIAAGAGGYPTSPGPVPAGENYDSTSLGQVAAGEGGYPTSPARGGLSAVPVRAAAPVGGLGALNIDLGQYQRQVEIESQRRNAVRQAELGMIDQRMGQLGKGGISDLDRASMLFQAAGAFAAPTRTGNFMENLGAAGTAVSGPLAKAAEAQRDREDKMMQLQLARSKLAAEMGTGGISAENMLKLYEIQQKQVQQPSEKERMYQRWQGEQNPQRKKALGDMLGIETDDPSEETSASIPAEVRAAGPQAVKKYREAYGTKIAGEMATAQTSADNMSAAIPVLDRAETAYKALEAGSGIGPIVSSNLGRTIGGVAKTENEINRQRFEQAAKELELLQAQIKMKGQGAITEGERRILAMTLPRLDAADPVVGIETLSAFRKQLQSAIDKPERIRYRGQEGSPPSGKSGSDPLSAARDAINRGAPRDAVIQRLKDNGIDTSGL